MEETKEEVMSEAEETVRIFEEYKQRLAEAIDKEKERVRKQAEQESANIIAETEQKAQQIAEKMIKEAEKESAGILTSSKGLAEQVISEADRLAKSVTELEEKVEQEIEKAKEKLRQEADIVVEATQKAEKTISQAGNRVQDELKESFRVITEVKQKLEQVAGGAEPEAKKEFEHRDEPVASALVIRQKREEAVEPRAAIADDVASRQEGDNKLFVGTLELDITPPGHSTTLEKLEKSLSQIPGLQILMTGGSADGKTRLAVFIVKPLPLLRLLKEMASVKAAFKDKDSIRVVLETSDQWVG